MLHARLLALEHEAKALLHHRLHPLVHTRHSFAQLRVAHGQEATFDERLDGRVHALVAHQRVKLGHRRIRTQIVEHTRHVQFDKPRPVGRLVVLQVRCVVVEHEPLVHGARAYRTRVRVQLDHAWLAYIVAQLVDEASRFVTIGAEEARKATRSLDHLGAHGLAERRELLVDARRVEHLDDGRRLHVVHHEHERTQLVADQVHVAVLALLDERRSRVDVCRVSAVVVEHVDEADVMLRLVAGHERPLVFAALGRVQHLDVVARLDLGEQLAHANVVLNVGHTVWCLRRCGGDRCTVLVELLETIRASQVSRLVAIPTTQNDVETVRRRRRRKKRILLHLNVDWSFGRLAAGAGQELARPAYELALATQVSAAC